MRILKEIQDLKCVPDVCLLTFCTRRTPVHILALAMLVSAASGCAGRQLRKEQDLRAAYHECIVRAVVSYRASAESPETVADAAVAKCRGDRAALAEQVRKYSHHQAFQGTGPVLSMDRIDEQETKDAIRQVVEQRL